MYIPILSVFAQCPRIMKPPAYIISDVKIKSALKIMLVFFVLLAHLPYTSCGRFHLRKMSTVDNLL